MNYPAHLKDYLARGLEIGKRVPHSEETVRKLEEWLNSPPNEKYFFSSLTGLLHDEFNDTCKKIEKIRNPEKSLLQKIGLRKSSVDINELVPYMTKVAYLLPMMLETAACSQKNHIERGDEGITTPGEIIFIKNTWPEILEEFKALYKTGAKFDINLIREVDSLYNHETIDWLKKEWFKKKETS